MGTDTPRDGCGFDPFLLVNCTAALWLYLGTDFLVFLSYVESAWMVQCFYDIDAYERM